jgi:hypothetical protein
LHVVPAGTQSRPAAQSTQVPLLQTLSVPQVRPLSTFIAVSVHVGVPPPQVNVPLWHGFVGVQAVPAAQATHEPLPQTMPAPQVVPFGLLPESMQTAVPVLQEVMPLRHGWPDTAHACPAAQSTHMPDRQTRSVPHAWPSVTAVVVSVQVGVPPAQDCIPTRQGFAGWQAAPFVQVTHSPFAQTRLVPQAVPAATLPASAQTGLPVAQAILPSLQGWPGRSQSVSTAHAMHVPVGEQTMPSPHGVPAD